MYISKEQQFAEIKQYLKAIKYKAPPCPDPYDGGCIGEKCIYCSVQECSAIVKMLEDQVNKEINQIKSLL